MGNSFVFSSGSVTEGHPDKLCDQISDALIDAYLTGDPASRVVAECVLAKGILFIALDFHSAARVDAADVARAVIARAGYTRGPFQARDCVIMTSLREHDHTPPRREETEMDELEIASVLADHPVTVFGYACRQSAELMPLPISLAHALARRLAAVRRGELPYLSPDGQAQVAVEYCNRRPQRIHSVMVDAATWDDTNISLRDLTVEVRRHVIDAVFESEPLAPDAQTMIWVNPRGLVGGGPQWHAGLTGRKTAIDTYGEFARHSGSALSGKDPGRIERVAAYGARWAAKTVVAAGLAEDCEVVLSYTIGRAEPVGVILSTFGSGHVAEDEIVRRLHEKFDFRPAAMVAALALKHQPARAKGRFYERLAAYGHVGRRDLVLPWEATDLAAALRA